MCVFFYFSPTHNCADDGLKWAASAAGFVLSTDPPIYFTKKKTNGICFNRLVDRHLSGADTLSAERRMAGR